MSSRNLVTFYHGEYEKAFLNWTIGEHDLADDQCRELISDYQCPRLLQIQAWTLRSVCADDYWLARSHLTDALDLIASLDDSEDAVLEETRAHTANMLENLDTEWKEHWEKLGKTPPTEQCLEDTYVAAYSPDATDDSGDAQAPEALDHANLSDLSDVGDSSDSYTGGEKMEVELPQKEMQNMTLDESPASIGPSRPHLQEAPESSMEP